MSNLGKSEAELRQLGRNLVLQYRLSEPSYAAAAQNMVTSLYQAFAMPNGQSLFALVRSFRLCRHIELPADAQTQINPNSGNYWLALMGTAGQESAWNDRNQSRGHRIIGTGAFPSPMLKAAFQQMNLDPDHPTNPVSVYEENLTIEDSIAFTRYFHVEKAVGSSYIVDQDTFVKPYGIQSVVGLGCTFLSGMFQFTLFFSKLTLNKEDALLLTTLAPHLSTLLAIYDEKNIF